MALNFIWFMVQTLFSWSILILLLLIVVVKANRKNILVIFFGVMFFLVLYISYRLNHYQILWYY